MSRGPENQDHAESSPGESPVEEAGVWIRDTLGRRAGGFYHLGYSSAMPAHWDSMEDLEDPSHLEEFRLVAEGMRAHGRGEQGLFVMVTDDQGSGRARCFLAFQIARLLGEGGARVLLADAEFEEEGPGDWLGESGREGLLDIARYGSSPRACIQRLILPNVDLMGVGSFRPGEGEALGEEEILSTLRQLRSGWDFVLAPAPPQHADGSFNTLFHHGDGVLMGVTLKGQARDRFEDLAEYLLDESVNVFGVMAFSEPGESAELPPTQEAPSRAPDKTPRAAPEDTPRPHPQEEPPSRGVSPYADLQRSRPHQSSRIFRNVAVGILVALAIFVGLWFGIQWLQRPEPVELPPLAHERDLGQPVQPSEEEGSTSAEPGEAAESADISPGESPETRGADREVAGAETTESSRLDAGGAGGEGASPATKLADGAPASTPSAVSAGEQAEVLPEPAKVQPEPVATPPSAPTDPLEAGLRRRPRSGYALHLWSFPDSMQAVPSVRKLKSEGYEPVIQGAEVRGKGTWYRVLVGNYATRREAMDARKLLSDRSDIDYVGVLRVGR